MRPKIAEASAYDRGIDTSPHSRRSRLPLCLRNFTRFLPALPMPCIEIDRWSVVLRSPLRDNSHEAALLRLDFLTIRQRLQLRSAAILHIRPLWLKLRSLRWWITRRIRSHRHVGPDSTPRNTQMASFSERRSNERESVGAGAWLGGGRCSRHRRQNSSENWLRIGLMPRNSATRT